MTMKKRIIKAVLFDFWGTLAYHRDDPSLVRLEQSFLSRPKKEKKQIQHIVMEQNIPTNQMEHELQQQFSFTPQEWKKIESFLNPFDLKLYPDTLPALMQLKQVGTKIGIVSNTQSEGLIQAIEKSGLSKWVDAYSWSFEVGATKPSHIIFDHALKQLKVKQNETIMVGDSLDTDVLGGKAAGLLTCLVDRTDSRSLPKECDFKVRQLTDIITWVKPHEKIKSKKQTKKTSRKKRK